MMRKLLLVGVVGLALAACQTTTEDEAMMTPTAVDSLIGKSLVTEGGGTFIFNADGTAGGLFRGEAVEGVYVATATEVCSTYTAPAPLTGREYCSTPVIADGTVVFNRRDGSSSPVYQIEG